MINHNSILSFQRAVKRNPVIVKYYKHWINSLDQLSSPLEEEIPWTTYESIEWLSKTINNEMNIFEWGSGGSTLFFSRRAKQIVTIEHNPTWYNTVTETILKRNINNVDIQLVVGQSPKADEKMYSSTDADSVGLSFYKYVSAIDKYPDNFFDVILVDGRSRRHCINHGITKLKLNGFLVLDNAERAEYSTGCELINHWAKTDYSGPGPFLDYCWTTRAFQKGEYSTK